MKTQIFPPPGQVAQSTGRKFPSTALIIGGVIVAAAIIYFAIIKPKQDVQNATKKTYSAE